MSTKTKHLDELDLDEPASGGISTDFDRGVRVSLVGVQGLTDMHGTVIHQHGETVWVDWDEEAFPHALLPQANLRPLLVN